MNAPEIERGERFITAMQEHWVRYIAPVLAFTILTAISMSFLYMAGVSADVQSVASDFLFLLGTIMLLVTFHGIFHLLFSRYLAQIIVTNKRVIKLEQRLLLQDEMIEIPLDKIRAVSAEKHGVLQSIFRYGTVTLDHHKITYVPHPHAVARDIAHVLEMK